MSLSSVKFLCSIVVKFGLIQQPASCNIREPQSSKWPTVKKAKRPDGEPLTLRLGLEFVCSLVRLNTHTTLFTKKMVDKLNM